MIKNIFWILFIELNGQIKVTDQQKYTNKYERKEEFLISRSNCGSSFFWTESTCGVFSPLCGSDGKIYINRCAFQEALCYNTYLTIDINDSGCNQGNIVLK